LVIFLRRAIFSEGRTVRRGREKETVRNRQECGKAQVRHNQAALHSLSLNHGRNSIYYW
jgi:hypothetical protein